MASLKKITPVIKRILSAKDLIAKIVCVIFAALLWTYINSTKIGDTESRIQVNTVNLPDNLIISKQSGKYITVKLTGRKDILKTLNPKSIKAVINLDQPAIGDYINYPIEISREEVPENVEIDLSQQSLKILIERKISKKVNVNIKLTGNLSEGFILGRIRVLPENVTITGPESIIEKIESVNTNSISIVSLKTRTVKEVSLSRSELNGIKANINRVKVIIPVIDTSKLIKFTKPVILRNKNNKYTYTLDNNDVTVYLKSNSKDIIPTINDFNIYINTGLNLDEILILSEGGFVDKDYPVLVNIKNENIKLILFTPETITVNIKENKPENTEKENEPI